MNALPTQYKGFRFRSRLEARWAVFFDTLKIEYSYEPEGFELGGVRYLPDFWLPQVKMFAEVKGLASGEPFCKEDFDKCQRLSEFTEKEVLMLNGPPMNQPYWATSSGENLHSYLINEPSRYWVTEGRFYIDCCDQYPEQTLDDSWVCPGVEASRAARFGT